MLLKQLHWLEITELVCLGATVISVLIAIASKILILPLIFLCLTLIFNVINRLRWQSLSRKRLSKAVKQLQAQISQEKQTLPVAENNQSAIAFPPSPIPNWNCVYTLAAHSAAVSSLAISADGKWLVSVSWDQSLKLWHLATAELAKTLTGHTQGLLAVVFTDEGNDEGTYQLATGGFDQTIKVWSLTSDAQNQREFTLKQTLISHTGSIHALAIAPHHRLLISGSYDQTVKQWDLATGDILKSFYDPLGAIYALAINLEQEFIASAGGDGQVTLWGSTSGKRIGFLTGNLSSVEALAISPDGQTIAVGCVDGTIKFWQLALDQLSAAKPLQPIRLLDSHAGQVKALVFSQSQQILFSSGADGDIKLWHPSSRNAIAVLQFTDDTSPRRNCVLSLALSPDEQFLVAGSSDGTIKIWQQMTGIKSPRSCPV